jgi:hypothetical protein
MMNNSTGHSQACHTSHLPISENKIHAAPVVQDDARQPKRPRVDAGNYHCCGISFGDKKSLTRHEKTDKQHCERSSKPFLPHICQQHEPPLQFARKDALTCHVKAVHLGIPRAPTRQQTHAQRTNGHTLQESTGQPYEFQVALPVNHAGASIDQVLAGTLFSSAAAQHESRTNDLQEPLPPHQGQFQDIKYRSGTTVPALIGKDPRSRQIRFPRPCPLCQQEFGGTVDDGLNADQHIRKHIKENHAMHEDSREVKIMCTDCDIPFWYDGDLEWHLKSAEHYKDCGFRFAHAGNQCNGHHPAIIDGQEHEDHRRFKGHLFAWGHSQHGIFVRYLGGYAKGNVRTNAPSPITAEDPRKAVVLQPTGDSQKARFLRSIADSRKAMFRRSTGSLYSVQSQLSWLSTPGYVEYSATVRKQLLPALEEIAPYNAKALMSKGIIKQAFDLEDDLKYDLAGALRRGKPKEFEQLLRRRGFLQDSFTEEADIQITTESLGTEVDATWFRPFLHTGKIECLAILVELGMQISVETVSRFVSAFQNKVVLQCILAVSTRMTITSRLMMCTFCCAISRRDWVAFDNMLNAGVCVSATVPRNATPSKPPLRPFMEALHRRYPRYRYAPSNMGLRNWSTDYILALAIDAKEWAVADRLIERGAGAYNILVRAAGTANVETLHYLCDRKVHLQSQPRRQPWEPHGSADVLHYLAHMMQFSERSNALFDTADYLIDRNIDVNARDDRGRTALEVICSASPDIAGPCALNSRKLAFRLMEKSTALSFPPDILSLLAHLETRSTVSEGCLSAKDEDDVSSEEDEPSCDNLQRLPPNCCSVRDIDRLGSKMEKLEMGAPRTTQIRLAAV